MCPMDEELRKDASTVMRESLDFYVEVGRKSIFTIPVNSYGGLFGRSLLHRRRSRQSAGSQHPDVVCLRRPQGNPISGGARLQATPVLAAGYRAIAKGWQDAATPGFPRPPGG